MKYTPYPPAHDHDGVVSRGLLHFLHVPNHFEQRLVVFRAGGLRPALVMQLGHLQRRGSLRQGGTNQKRNRATQYITA